ncbi:sensor-domain containing phosphodiesterase [Salmonella enterica]|nr:sensor-domain containing phosphodiesterase [Salmonella enterica]
MRVSRSLTIKQMAMVAAVVMVFVFVFCTVLLFHLVQQNRYNTATQLESIARSVREPLSSAILKADLPGAETILESIKPAGVVSRADVVLPNQFQALRKRFIPERPVPVMVTRLFELPVQISLPVYSLERPANPQPLAYLVLQADSYRMYKFVMSALSTLVTIYLLLSLILTVAIAWCVNRLIVHPLRKIARELNDIPQQELIGHQLALPRLHQDDEIGMLVRSYNLNQQLMQRQREEQTDNAMRFPVSELPNKAFLMALLEQVITRQQTTALIIVTCETLRDPAQMEAAQQRLTEESDILTALDNHQFAIWLQPQVEMRSGNVLSAEALLRMQQPDGSWELPEGLIERIESCGLMVTVGHWVLEESCRQLAAWQERGVTLPLSVNLSALQLMHPGMVSELLELLNRYRIQPGTLILEVTESRRIDDPHAAVAILRPLRNAGVRIALDDFGMGYAGLRQLQHMKSLPVDILKIDKMFVDGLPDDHSMVTAIILMARSLNLQLIAEGVENEAQRAWLEQAGVNVAQGFLFARPVPADIFEERYLSHENPDYKS